MSAATELMVNYAAYHRDRRNIATHFVGIPMIVFAVGALLARPAVPVGGWPVTPAALAWALTTLWYLTRGDLALGLAVSVANLLLFLAALPLGQLDIVPWLAWSLAAFVVGLSGSVTVQTRRKILVPAALLCGVGAGALALLTRTLDLGYLASTGVAAIIVGLVGRLVAARLHVPPMTLVVPASFGLLPGLSIFRALYAMVAETGTDAGLLSLQSGFTTLLGAGAALLAIATGTVFGEILASRWDPRVSSVRSR